MKIHAIAFANAVKCGRSEENILLSSRDNRDLFEITLEDKVLIKIKCLTTKFVTYTSLFNTKWFKLEPDEVAKKEDEVQVQDAPKKKTKGTTKL